jgi:hypothetical protein
MLIVTAVNITEERGRRTLARKDGTADYAVQVAINAGPPIFSGEVRNHVRKENAAKLLRLIADEMDKEEFERFYRSQDKFWSWEGID